MPLGQLVLHRQPLAADQEIQLDQVDRLMDELETLLGVERFARRFLVARREQFDGGHQLAIREPSDLDPNLDTSSTRCRGRARRHRLQGHRSRGWGTGPRWSGRPKDRDIRPGAALGVEIRLVDQRQSLFDPDFISVRDAFGERVLNPAREMPDGIPSNNPELPGKGPFRGTGWASSASSLETTSGRSTDLIVHGRGLSALSRTIPSSR